MITEMMHILKDLFTTEPMWAVGFLIFAFAVLVVIVSKVFSLLIKIAAVAAFALFLAYLYNTHTKIEKTAHTEAPKMFHLQNS